MTSRKKRPDEKPWQLGLSRARRNPLFDHLFHRCWVREETANSRVRHCPPSGWAVVLDDGSIAVNGQKRATPDEWAYVFAHAALHLGFGHFQKREHGALWNLACCAVVTRFLDALKVGSVPEDLLHEELPPLSEERLYERLCQEGVPEQLKGLSLAGPSIDDLWFSANPGYGRSREEWMKAFASGLSSAVEKVLTQASSAAHTPSENSLGNRARRWLIDHYPLLGGLALQLSLIEDPAVLSREGVGIAAVSPSLGEVYLNSRRLDEEEARFVLAHELLHVGLSHGPRRQGRDPFLWNVACDCVINQWLLELGVGRMPQVGALYDRELAGLSAEAIYDRITQDLRRYRKLATLRGPGEVDILPSERADLGRRPDGTSLDEFYRSCLAQGLEYHLACGRGLLPAGLVEEIRALALPPVPWDVELGRLFDSWFPPLERRRTYARPSRRQSSTPDIPRPRAMLLASDLETRTFGVVLDTSGSMDRYLLAQALGAMASYALSRDVHRIRVVHCDAAPYDQGYVLAESLLESAVRVLGRGGTILQPGIDLLETARDFPGDAPIMVLTDAGCDAFTVKRRVAYLVPEGRALPFIPTGPVFRLK